MSIKDVLKPFKRRLLAEAWIRSTVLGAMIAAAVAVVLGGVHWFLPQTVTGTGILIAFAVVLVLGTGLSLVLLYRPTERDTARRLDSLGMDERVETMLEYEHSVSPAARLQREETMTRLQGINSRTLKFSVSKTLLMLCGALFVCATVLLFIPDIRAFSRPPLVNELHEMVEDSDLSDEFRAELEEILQDLEKELEESKDRDDVDQALDSAMDRLEGSVDKEVSREELGDTLKDYDDLKELGEAIQKGDRNQVSSALEHLKEVMEGDPDRQQSVAEQLQNALNASKIDASNDLREALENMKNGLSDADAPVEEVLDRAEAEINDALNKQQNAQTLGDQMKEQLGDQMTPGDGKENEGEQEGDGSDNGNSSDQGPEGDGDEQEGGQSGIDGDGDGNQGSLGNHGRPGQMPDAGSDGITEGGSVGGGQTNMKDHVYDPQAGDVSYGQVYAAYVADFLAQAERGELSADVVEAMNAYFESLKNQSNGGN